MMQYMVGKALAQEHQDRLGIDSVARGHRLAKGLRGPIRRFEVVALAQVKQHAMTQRLPIDLRGQPEKNLVGQMDPGLRGVNLSVQVSERTGVAADSLVDRAAFAVAQRHAEFDRSAALADERLEVLAAQISQPFLGPHRRRHGVPSENLIA